MPGPYAIPLNAPIEGGEARVAGDRHALAVDKDNCILYELYAAYPQSRQLGTAGVGRHFQFALQRAASRGLDLDGWQRGLPVFVRGLGAL